jgi:signal transduction histidine kinase
MTDRPPSLDGSLARIEVLEQDRRSVFEEAQREADAMFAQYQLSQLLASDEPLEPLAAAVLAEITRATGAARSALWLASPTGGPMRLVATAGPPTDEPLPDHDGPGAADRWALVHGWSGVQLDEARDVGRLGIERSAIGFLGVRPGPDAPLDDGHARYLALVRRELAITFRAAQLRNALTSERATLAAILEGASDAIVAVDSDLRVVVLNAAASQLLRLGSAAATGARCRDVLGCQLPGSPSDDRPSLACDDTCPFLAVMTTGRPITAREQTVRARDPEPIPVAASYAATTGGPVAAVTVLRDLRPAQALDQLKSSFVAAVSHELRTPLALISGYAQSLVHLDLDEPTTRRHAEQIQLAVGRLTELVDQILDTSHIESDQLALHRSAVVLPTLIRSFVEEQRHLPSPALIEARVATRLPAVDVDPSRIRQVLANLVANSTKYAGPDARVSISARRLDARTVAVTVADDGVGIEPDERDRVFERFYRGRWAHESRIAGSGLGLYLCRRLIESHGGWIRIDATVRGTSITFGLPVHREPRDAIEASSS